MPGSPSALPEALFAPRPCFAERGEGEPLTLGASLPTGKKVHPDIVGLLMEDHRIVLGWFDWYETEQRAELKPMIATNIVKALRAHMAMEEEFVYPTAARQSRIAA